MTISMPSGAHAPGVVLSGVGTATIDGILSPGEWDTADTLGFVANLPGGTVPATLFVMNDAGSLYMAVKVEHNTLGRSSVAFEFDNDHDGTRENGDDAVILNTESGFFDNFRTNEPPCPAGVNEAACGFSDTDFGGTNDGDGVATNNGSFSFYETSHPLDSLDDPHDFSLVVGDTVGFFIHFVFCNPAVCSETLVPGPTFVSFHDIVIATPIVGVAIDIKPGSFPNSINPRSRGVIPVAVLSSSTFSAPESVDTTSLTFGRTGNENSLAFCDAGSEDVNTDGFLDLVCHFNTQQTGFQSGNTAGVLKGKTVGDIAIIGTDSVRIVP
jgi:hypothetical protein